MMSDRDNSNVDDIPNVLANKMKMCQYFGFNALITPPLLGYFLVSAFAQRKYAKKLYLPPFYIAGIVFCYFVYTDCQKKTTKFYSHAHKSLDQKLLQETE